MLCAREPYGKRISIVFQAVSSLHSRLSECLSFNIDLDIDEVDIDGTKAGDTPKA